MHAEGALTSKKQKNCLVYRESARFIRRQTGIACNYPFLFPANQKWLAERRNKKWRRCNINRKKIGIEVYADEIVYYKPETLNKIAVKYNLSDEDRVAAARLALEKLTSDEESFLDDFDGILIGGASSLELIIDHGINNATIVAIANENGINLISLDGNGNLKLSDD